MDSNSNNNNLNNISVRYPATDRQLRSRLRGNVSYQVLSRWLNRASRLGKPGIVRLILDKLGEFLFGPNEFWPNAIRALGAMLRPRPVPIWKEPRAIQDRYFETVKMLVDAGALRFQTNLPERPLDSLLFLAITQSTPRIVRFLVTREIRIYQRSRTSTRYVISDAFSFYEQHAAIALGNMNTAEAVRFLEMRREMNKALFNGRVGIPSWVYDINRSNSNSNSSNSNSKSAHGGLSGITSNVPRAVSGNSRAASMVSNASYKNAIAFNEVNSSRGVYVRGSNQRPNKKIVRVYHRKTLAELLRRGSGTARHPFNRSEFTATSVRRVPMKR